MRKLHRILAIVLYLPLGQARAQTLYQARGFDPGSCYETIGSIDCKNRCVLHVFPTSNGQLSFEISNPEETPTKAHPYHMVRFLVTGPKGNRAEIKSYRPLSEKEAENITFDLMGHKVACQAK